MKKLERIAALLLAVTLLVTLLGSMPAFGAVVSENSYVENPVLYSNNGAVEEDDSDVDVPFEPEKVVRSLRIQTKPSKLAYLQGQALDTTGMVVKAIYTDNSTAIVTNYKVSGYNPNTLGQQTITVSSNGKSATFKVTVYAAGDVNGDGTVDGNDATLLLQYEANWPVTIQTVAADTNGDGTVNGEDATLLMQYAAGWNVTLG